ncbi:TonB-dependent receptor [Fretibacter rubidus]|uniref:TonB-dependent receptor n=1 Tax=Fretibacter rubidus TaxID=570162 RepID=UPI00352B15F6
MNNQDRWISRLLLGTSVLAMMASATVAVAQDNTDDGDEVIVTGIRQSLKASMDVKRNSKGIVDAITAEDIGKFPDTNLAESLQRIPGVSIDRQNGEGATVTVRGWGADYNLVTFNGRVMPTSSIGDGASRSFDFGNLASEAIASVEVYKTSKVNVASGGAGATINIKTAKPLEASGRTATIGVKGVYDTGQIDSKKITPEISGLYINQFANDRLGVAVSGSYQKREGGIVQSNVGWRDGYLGSEDFGNEWGRLPSATGPNSWNFNDGIVNRPGDTDVYEVPQNADYALTDYKRERINGQLVLQYDITDKLRATGDITYSSNEVETNSSSAGVWFNHDQTNSAWTDGPVAGPLYYTEFFGNPTDLSYSGSLSQSMNENISLGFNLAWDVTDRLNLALDYNDASAESKPTNRFGSSMSVGTTVFGIAAQTVNFENDLPVISFVDNGIGAEDASVREHSGSTFSNNYMRSDVQQLQLNGDYEIDRDIIDSVDFGFSWLKNDVRSDSGFIQTDSWGGELGDADDIPDDIFEWITLPDQFSGVSGADDPNMLQGLYRFDFAQMVDLLEDQFGICSSPWVGSTSDNPGTCLADRTNSRQIEEETFSAYAQFNSSFNWGSADVNITTGARYEHTDVFAPASVQVPTGTSWPGGNEFFLTFDGGTEESEFDGSYDFFLPSVDFDIAFANNVKLRGAYSKTIGRHRYDQIQGGLTLDSLFRAVDGTGRSGNPSLEPFTSDNYDVSAEWYYGDNSYISVGYFKKNINNFIGTGRFTENYYGLTHPGLGARAAEARAAGANSAAEILAYYQANYPELVVDGAIIGAPDDPLLNFQVEQPVASDRTDGFDGWEFALQHTFGDSGFGIIANYTIANTELEYDNTQSFRVDQLAIAGVSDSANLVGFYDKNGLQARVAWNWRDDFLAGSGRNPFYVEAYDQIDANISYDIRDNFTVFAEGIDITGSDRRGHRRSVNNAFFMNPQSGRYAVGARYKF